MYSEIIQNWKKANPLACHGLGIHELDGQLPDYSKEHISKRIKQIKKDLAKLEAAAVSSNQIKQYNHELLRAVLDKELFELDVRKEYKTNPAVYVFPLAVIETSYTVRNFDTIENRISSITEIQNKIPSFLDQAKANLEDKLPNAKVQMAIQFLNGIMSYYKDKLIEFISQSSDEEQLEEWTDVNQRAIMALDKFKQVLEEVYLPLAHNEFSLGEEKFLQLLNKQEGVEISVAQLLRVGEMDLERNYNTLIELSEQNGGLDNFIEQIYRDTPDPSNLINEAAKTLDRTKQFLKDSGFVDIPTDKQCKVIPTPEFARAFASGAMNTPGPFEPSGADEAYYWVTPPDPTMSKEKTEDYMKFFSKPMLEILTIHEAWPGHYLQLLFNNKSDNDFAKMFARSTSMIEGWAHYSEEEIFNAGYEPFDRDLLHGAQLLKALLRNARYIAAVKMHCRGMTVEEAKVLFREKAFMTPVKAELEANRGTINPMYLNYTLGKLMIYKLRNDYQREKEQAGKSFSLRQFHNDLLSYGSPPISVIRNLMLTNPGHSQDIL